MTRVASRRGGEKPTGTCSPSFTQRWWQEGPRGSLRPWVAVWIPPTCPMRRARKEPRLLKPLRCPGSLATTAQPLPPRPARVRPGQHVARTSLPTCWRPGPPGPSVCFLTKQNRPEAREWIEDATSGNLDFIYTEGFPEAAPGLEAGRRHGNEREALLTSCDTPRARERGGGGTGAGALGGSARRPSSPPPVPTCAAEGHGADGGQVDGVSLFPREELEPHVTDADEEEGAQGQEVACGGRGRGDPVSTPKPTTFPGGVPVSGTRGPRCRGAGRAGAGAAYPP